MKRFLLVGLSCVALSACDTFSDMSMPSLSSLNPFGTAEKTQNQEKGDAKNDPLLPVPENSTALETEMSEMEHLTGYAPRFSSAQVSETVDDVIMPDVPVQTVETSDIADIADTHTPAPQSFEDERIAIETTTEVTEQPKPQEPANITPPAKTQAPATDTADSVHTAPSPVSTPVSAAEDKAVAVTPAPDFAPRDLQLSSAKGCPKVTIMPAARSMTYFENEMSGQLVARGVINEIRGGCEIVSGGMEVDLDILMHGKIGDKGRFEGRKDMESFMTFPYFVAVSDPQGLPVSKKILATAMRFKPVIDDLQHAEKITQFIPMTNPKEAANYTITIGFQLNRKQLEYNRATTVNRVDNVRVAPDLRNRSRVSTNPLAD